MRVSLGAKCNTIRYGLKELYSLRPKNGKLPSIDAVLDNISAAGILRYRGCRAGSHSQRVISVVIDNRPSRFDLNKPHSRMHQSVNKAIVRPRILRQIDRTNNVVRLPTSTPVLPTTYVLNACSLAKPHALE